MMLVGLLMGLIVSFLLGGIIISYLDRKNELNGYEKLSLSFLLGNGAITLILFWLSFFYLPYKIEALSLVIIGLFLYVMRKRPSVFAGGLKMGMGTIAKWDAKKVMWAVIFAVIVLKMSYSFIETASKPEYSWDASSHWTYPGKIISDLDQRKMGDIPSILTKFPDHVCHYPKFIPYLHYWLFSWMGQPNDQWSKIFIPISLLCFLMLFYSALKKNKGAVEALFYVWLLLSAPLYLYHSTFGYADLTSSIYFSTGILMFYRWIKEKHDVYFYLFSIFLGLTTWIKAEGRPLYLIGLAVLAAYLWIDYDKQKKDKLVKVVQYLAAYVVTGLPWQAYLFIKQMGDIYNFEPYYGQFLPLLNSIYGNLFVDGSWGVVWVGVIAALLLFYKNLIKPENKCLFMVLALFHILIPFIYMSFNMFVWSGAAINRQWLNIYPIAIFTAGCIIPRFAELLPMRSKNSR